MHMMISAFCFFRVSNRHTFGALFGVDMLDPARRDRYRRMIGDMVVSYLSAQPTADDQARHRGPRSIIGLP